MANRRRKGGWSDRFPLLGSKIIADGDCSHEIRRRLLLGRKAMTNLHSVSKSRDITLPMKVRIVKAMVFPVVTYGCESWTVKEAERQKMDAFELWCWWRLPRVSWTARRSNHSILRKINPEYSLEGLMLKLKLCILVIWCEQLTYWKSPWCWERLRAEEEGIRGWDGWFTSPNGHALGQTLGDGEGQGGLACCSPWGRKELDMTGQLNNSNLKFQEPGFESS